jgi:hypothetical protein
MLGLWLFVSLSFGNSAVFPIPDALPSDIVLGHWPESSYMPGSGCGCVVTSTTILLLSSEDGSVVFSQDVRSVMADPSKKADVVVLFPGTVGGPPAMLLVGTAGWVGVGISTRCSTGFARNVGQKVAFPNVTKWEMAYQSPTGDVVLFALGENCFVS